VTHLATADTVDGCHCAPPAVDAAIETADHVRHGAEQTGHVFEEHEKRVVLVRDFTDDAREVGPDPPVVEMSSSLPGR
jgi:hypothetical protein